MPPPPADTPHWPRLVPLALAAALGLYLFAANADVRRDVADGLEHRFDNRPLYLAAAAVAAIALIPGVAARLSRGLDRLRQPRGLARLAVAALVFAAAVAYLLLTAHAHGRELFPKLHDEFMYLVQAQHLATGRLWLPPHDLADFFDSYFLVVRPVYAATYFPGTALAYVPGVWLGLPPWVTAVVVAGLLAAMLYHVVTDLVDGVAGLLAVLMLFGLEQYRLLGTMNMSHTVLLLMFLVAVAAYLRWRATRRVGWAVPIGAAAGWAAITRPLDAICLLAPLGVAIAWDLARTRPLRSAAAPLLAMTLAALPFCAVQLVFGYGVTGHPLRPPISEYGRANFPGLALGYHGHPEADAGSPSHRPQVRDFYDAFLKENLKWHAWKPFKEAFLRDRLRLHADCAVPVHAFYALLPLGLVAAWRHTRAGLILALAAGAVILPFVYTFWPPWVRFYGVLSAVGFVALALLGADAIRRTFPAAGAALALAIAVLSIGATPEARAIYSPQPAAEFRDAPIQAHRLADVNRKLAALPHAPAVVLFRYTPGQTDVYQEPVYNIDSANPDDATVIRANDLGDARNAEIFRYYATREPRRYFYRYDRVTGELTPLGWDRDLAK